MLMPQFDLATFPGQIFWLVTVFGLQYFFVAKLIVPRFKILFSKRKNYLDQQLQQTEELSAQAEKLRLDYENKLEEHKKHQESLMKNATEAILSESETSLAEVEQKFSQDMRAQEEKFKKFNQNMGPEVNDAALNLASDILSRITEEKVNKKKLAKYVS